MDRRISCSHFYLVPEGLVPAVTGGKRGVQRYDCWGEGEVETARLVPGVMTRWSEIVMPVAIPW